MGLLPPAVDPLVMYPAVPSYLTVQAAISEQLLVRFTCIYRRQE